MRRLKLLSLVYEKLKRIGSVDTTETTTDTDAPASIAAIPPGPDNTQECDKGEGKKSPKCNLEPPEKGS